MGSEMDLDLLLSESVATLTSIADGSAIVGVQDDPDPILVDPFYLQGVRVEVLPTADDAASFAVMPEPPNQVVLAVDGVAMLVLEDVSDDLQPYLGTLEDVFSGVVDGHLRIVARHGLRRRHLELRARSGKIYKAIFELPHEDRTYSGY